MKIHFLVSCKEGFMLHHRACDNHHRFCTRGRNKKQGSFKRKDVNCGSCIRTEIFLKG